MTQITENLMRVKNASSEITSISSNIRNQVLTTLAQLLKQNIDEIITANILDLSKKAPQDPLYDRLKLDNARINAISQELQQVAHLDSPLGITIENRTLDNGLNLQKISVPLGVVAVIYESRPNVTVDVFSLCFKSGNAVVLKGGGDASATNQCLVKLIKQSLVTHKINPKIIYLMPTERSAVNELLNAIGIVDVCIPRGGQELIKFVRENSKIPVIETGAGIVHTYFDESGDLAQGVAIINNAKTRRVSVCNALDTLIIHKNRLSDLPQLTSALANSKVIIYADDTSFAALVGEYPSNLLMHADTKTFDCEFLDYKLAIKTVDNIEAAIKHIQTHSSGHSEAIISTDNSSIELFINSIDAAVVYVNASTAFTDGAWFGLGSEIGISTQKLHARGPMGLKELTSYKWIVRGNGQIRK